MRNTRFFVQKRAVFPVRRAAATGGDKHCNHLRIKKFKEDFMLNNKDLLGLYHTSAEEICEILDRAAEMKALLLAGRKAEKLLSGTALITLFYENSTRTRTSFELAGKYLGASEVNVSASSSSVQKGETLIDTGKTLDAMKIDFIAIRHPLAGAPKLLAENVHASVINAGDGMNEHPTQALLDMFSMREKFGRISGLKVAILGDIKHSRVAKSNLFGLKNSARKFICTRPKRSCPRRLKSWARTSAVRWRRRLRAPTA